MAALRSAFQIAQVGGWEVDFINDRTFFSPELCELLGSPPLQAMPNAEAQLLWYEGDRAAYQDRLALVEQGAGRLSFEGRTVAPDGGFRWWRLFGEPVVENGRCVALRGAAQDITLWRAAAARERAALDAHDAKSGFLATMSHELRTPLNGVLGMAQAMGRDELSQPQRERLSVIKSSGEALLSLLDDLLDLSRLDTGEIELEIGVVDLQELAEGAQWVFAGLADKKGLSLGVEVSPDARGQWAADPRRVRQVLHNLIANAIKFTDRGSIRVEFTASAEGLTLRVTDTGVGIPQSALGEVFDRFFQVDASATRKNGGPGLGLSVCRDLVGLMGGEMRVESAVGEGSTFTALLPLARAGSAAEPGQEAPAPDDDPAAGVGMRVLTAEDNEVNQRVLKALLGAAGIETLMVANGQEAVDAWRDQPWDIVLMDIQMPVMDGIAATKVMREVELSENRRHTPIIALTANAMSHHEAEYMAAGMDAMVAKPIDLALLIRAMDTAMQHAEGRCEPGR